MKKRSTERVTLEKSLLLGIEIVRLSLAGKTLKEIGRSMGLKDSAFYHARRDIEMHASLPDGPKDWRINKDAVLKNINEVEKRVKKIERLKKEAVREQWCLLCDRPEKCTHQN